MTQLTRVYTPDEKRLPHPQQLFTPNGSWAAGGSLFVPAESILQYWPPGACAGFMWVSVDAMSSWVQRTSYMWNTAFHYIPFYPGASWCSLTQWQWGWYKCPTSAEQSKVPYSQHCDQLWVSIQCCLLHKEVLWPRLRAALTYVYKQRYFEGVLTYVYLAGQRFTFSLGPRVSLGL